MKKIFLLVVMAISALLLNANPRPLNTNGDGTQEQKDYYLKGYRGPTQGDIEMPTETELFKDGVLEYRWEGDQNGLGYFFVLVCEAGQTIGKAYMAKAYSTDTHCTLADWETTGYNEKLGVPAQSATFYLYDNGDGTLELSTQEIPGKRLVNSEDIYYTVTVQSADYSMGSTSGSTYVEANSSVTIRAIPKDGYRFTQWSDGNTDNPRIVKVTQDLTFTAEFAKVDYAAKVWPILMDGQTFEKNEAFVVADFRPNDVDQFIYIWDNSYEGGEARGKNFYGNSEGYISLVVTDRGWAGCGYYLDNESLGLRAAWALREAIIANPDDYFLHLAIKSTDNGSHCFRIMDSEATQFVIGSKSVYNGPVYSDFARDGKWHEFFIPMSAYASALANADLQASNMNIFVALSEGTQGVQLDLDAMYFCDTEFMKRESNYCGEELTWHYIPETTELVIEGTGAMENYSSKMLPPWSEYTASITSVSLPTGLTSIGSYAFAGCTKLTSVTIPNSVTSIREYTFAGCTELEYITLGAGMQEIKDYAFKDCKRIMDIKVLSERVIDITQYTFDNIGNKEYVYVYVPDGSLRSYQRDTYWNEFDLKVLGATTVTDAEEDVVVTPDDNSANITWPQVTNAATYELVIRDAEGNEICTLVFNSEGYLVSITFAAPSRRGEAQETQTVAGFSFTITSLNPGSTYFYVLTAKDDKGTAIDSKDGSFATIGAPMAIEKAEESELSVQKLFQDGQLFILRDGEVYNAQGARVE